MENELVFYKRNEKFPGKHKVLLKRYILTAMKKIHYWIANNLREILQVRKLTIINIIIFPLLFNVVICANNTVKDKETGDFPEIAAPPKSLNLDPFYKKYLNANGIGIASSWRVPDSALYQAWRIIKFMTEKLPDEVLNSLIEKKTRITVMARYEGTTDVPEHAYLAKDTSINWDLRARGLGGDEESSLTSCAEENLLCYQIDKYHAEDILIHEFAHTIHGAGIIPVNASFNDLLQEKLDKALSEGKYKRTYAATNIWEYWAEGVQNWFNVNAEVAVPDGKHNWVNTREDMKKYDPDLYEIISQYFPEFDESPSCHSHVNQYKE